MGVPGSPLPTLIWIDLGMNNMDGSGRDGWDGEYGLRRGYG